MEESSYKQVGEEEVYRNPWITMKSRRMERSDGSITEWGVMELAGEAVFIVALNEKNEVYLTRQFRVPLERHFWEIPSGGADGQDPLEAAKRELMEEAHLEADDWEVIGHVHPYPVFSTELAHLYLARSIREVEGSREEQIIEGISEVRAVSFAEVLRMINEGEITHAVPVLALLRVAIKLGLC